MKRGATILLIVLTIFSFACSHNQPPPLQSNQLNTELILDDFSTMQPSPFYDYDPFGPGIVSKAIEPDSEFNKVLKLNFTPQFYNTSSFVPFSRFIFFLSSINWRGYNLLNLNVKPSTNNITLILMLHENSGMEPAKSEVWSHMINSQNFKLNEFNHIIVPLNQSSFTLDESTATDRKLDFTKITSLQLLIKTFEVNKTESISLAKMYLSN